MHLFSSIYIITVCLVPNKILPPDPSFFNRQNADFYGQIVLKALWFFYSLNVLGIESRFTLEKYIAFVQKISVLGIEKCRVLCFNIDEVRK